MRKFLLSLFAALACIGACAQDFDFAHAGQTLTYTVLNEAAKTCSTREGLDKYEGAHFVTGSLVIPATVSDGTTDYTVTEVGYCSFSSNYKLTAVTLPSTIISIGDHAFYDCNRMKSINLPGSLTTIGPSAFSSCMNLASLEIPGSVTKIGAGAFVSCRAIKSMTIPNSVTSLGEGAFLYCYGLKSVKLSESLTAIVKGTFWGCNSLASITIPASVRTIGEMAFHDCAKLATVTLPKSLTSMDVNVFNACDSLATIYCPAIRPAVCKETTFNSSLTARCKLYVPAASVAAYRSAPGWKDFANIIAYDFGQSDILGDVNGDFEVNVTDTNFTVSAILGDTPQGFIERNADINSDLELNVTDVNLIVDIALGASASAPQRVAPQRAVASADNGYLFLDSFFLAPGEEKEMPVRLSAPRRYGSFQTDIYMPAGVEFVMVDEDGDVFPDAWLNPAVATRSHTLSSRVQPSGALRVIAYSSNNSLFRESADDVLFYVRVRANADFNPEPQPVWFRKTIFNVGIEEYRFIDCNPYMNVDGVMGRADVEVATDAVYYNLQGQPVLSPERGHMYICVQGGKASKVVL